MGPDRIVCPGCAAEMEVGLRRSDHAREYVCAHCSSVVAAAPVFRRLLGDHRFAAVWNAPAGPVPGPPCCFCHASMGSRSLDAGHAAVCHTCQVLWFDRAALESLPAAEEPPALSGVAMEKCPCCGAPVGPLLPDRCRFCGTALESGGFAAPALGEPAAQ